ncbi:MAG: CvpA family protein [Phycisphaerae bacterium]|nr:CvpA family protein [Phycisphaerae bacterium]MDD5381336.1 CvpA family protein [Phycisphaerae bacterium]
MGSLLVLLIILGCVVYLYLKGTLVKSFAMVIVSICASIVAFGYFELSGNFLIGRKILVSWAYPLSFILLFVLVFAILQTIASQLTLKPVDLGFLPERIGRVICGILLGLMVSGVLLATVAMAPLSPKYPYQRFDVTNPDAETPKKVLPNADGFATGWFNIISSGSFSGKRSFATMHPAFIDQLFLNRLEINNRVPVIAVPDAIEIPKIAVWPAPEDLKDSEGNPIQPKSGHTLTIIRVGMVAYAIIPFTPSQLRVICKEKEASDDKDQLAGKGENIYPVGYMKTVDELRIRKLVDHIDIKKADISGRMKEIDFVFYVPDGFKPVLVEYKQNCVRQIPQSAVVSAEQAPSIVPFEKPPEPVRVSEPNKPVEQPKSPSLPASSAQPGPRDANK